MKTTAAILRSGMLVGCCETSLRAGEQVSYGSILGNSIHEVGRGKLSRARKWLCAIERDLHLSAGGERTVADYAVNQGGGPAV